VGVKSLGVAAEAYAKAQTTTVGSVLTGQTSTSVTGDTDKYVLGKAASEGANEISAWLMQRLKNSFDAVVTPAGAQIVVHIDRQIAIDKEANGRKIVHKYQTTTVNAGTHYGLD
jgi:integrating conjugative element protein (TIGR03752 family)